MKTVIQNIDPTNYWLNQGAPISWCVEACGLIPYFIDTETDELLIDDAINNYGFPTSDLTGLVIEGVYHSPHKRDEPLHPYMSIQSGDETLYIYPYGIVASVLNQEGENTQVITRMD